MHKRKITRFTFEIHNEREYCSDNDFCKEIIINKYNQFHFVGEKQFFS